MQCSFEQQVSLARLRICKNTPSVRAEWQLIGYSYRLVTAVMYVGTHKYVPTYLL